MRFSFIGLFAASLATLGTCFQQVHARPNAYQTLACQELLRGLLARPDTLKVGQVELISKEEIVNDEGSVIIYFIALDKYGKEVESRAFCSVENRASASIMDIQHVDHMKF
jgi:hypothetical protein